MRIYNNKVLKVLAVVLCVLLTYPAFLVSASALDTVKETTPEIVMPTLRSMMETRSEEKIRVAIWLKDYDTEEAIATGSLPDYQTRLSTIQEVERTSTAPNETMRSIETKRAALRLCYEPYTADFGTDFLTNEEKIYCSTYLPIIIAELTPARIEQISNLEVVESIDYYCDDVVEEDNVSDSTQGMSDSNSTRAANRYYSVENNIQYINAGTLRNSMTSSDYISVGILDDGNPNYNHSIFSDNTVWVRYPTANTYSHATNTLEILSSVVPYAEFYCTTYLQVDAEPTANYISEIDWLVDCGVNVINISLKIHDTQTEALDTPNTYGTISEYLDKIVYVYGVLIVKTAGNASYDSSIHGVNYGINSGGMAYNVLTVGNFNRGINSMDESSCYYSGSGLTNKPDISAPGYFTFQNGSGYDSGTSCAAPLVSGVAALLMATNDSLIQRPSLVKAILMASTNSDHQYTMKDVEYRYYGAGVVDAENARVASMSTNYRTAIAETTLGEYKEYTVSATAGSVVRIALAFEKTNTHGVSFPLGNLDLRVNDSSQTELDSSITTTNNVEMVEFTAPSTGSYVIRVITYAIPQVGTSKAYDSFSLAWSIGGN